jgi:uncharacterized membrane protein
MDRYREMWTRHARARHAHGRHADHLTSAGRHFNRGQRAFFFALAYLGWFISPSVFMVTTAVMWARQFVSDSRRAVLDE